MSKNKKKLELLFFTGGCEVIGKAVEALLITMGEAVLFESGDKMPSDLRLLSSQTSKKDSFYINRGVEVYNENKLSLFRSEERCVAVYAILSTSWMAIR